MLDVDVAPFEIETTAQFPVLLGTSSYQEALRYPPGDNMFQFIEYGPMQFHLDEGYAYVAIDMSASGRSTGEWNAISLTEGEATHDMIENVAGQDCLLDY